MVPRLGGFHLLLGSRRDSRKWVAMRGDDFAPVGAALRAASDCVAHDRQLRDSCAMAVSLGGAHVPDLFHVNSSWGSGHEVRVAHLHPCPWPGFWESNIGERGNAWWSTLWSYRGIEDQQKQSLMRRFHVKHSPSGEAGTHQVHEASFRTPSVVSSRVRPDRCAASALAEGCGRTSGADDYRPTERAVAAGGGGPSRDWRVAPDDFVTTAETTTVFPLYSVRFANEGHRPSRFT